MKKVERPVGGLSDLVYHWPAEGGGYGRNEEITAALDACAEWLVFSLGNAVTVCCDPDGRAGGVYHAETDTGARPHYGLYVMLNGKDELVYTAQFAFPPEHVEVAENVPSRCINADPAYNPAGCAQVFSPPFTTLEKACQWLLCWGGRHSALIDERWEKALARTWGWEIVALRSDDDGWPLCPMCGEGLSSHVEIHAWGVTPWVDKDKPEYAEVFAVYGDLEESESDMPYLYCSCCEWATRPDRATILVDEECGVCTDWLVGEVWQDADNGFVHPGCCVERVRDTGAESAYGTMVEAYLGGDESQGMSLAEMEGMISLLVRERGWVVRLPKDGGLHVEQADTLQEAVGRAVPLKALGMEFVTAAVLCLSSGLVERRNGKG